MEIVGVIPARFASTRLPGKALLSETGRPLILHVIEAARRSQSLQRIIVATDDSRIAEVVTGAGGEVMMTRADHPTGTDRVAEVAARLERASIIVNLQGDEPEISGEALDLVAALLANDRDAPMATLATPIRDASIYADPACVKVVCNQRGRALYFSRSPIPCHRDGLPDPATAAAPVAYLHLGLYAYRRDFLLALASLPPHRSRPPRNSSSSVCSRPATRSPLDSSTSRAWASTHPMIIDGSSRGGASGTINPAKAFNKRESVK